MNSGSEVISARTQNGAGGAFPPPAGFEVTLQSDPCAVRDALKGIASGLRDNRLSEEEIGSVELVLAEVLNNIVEHAYPAEGLPGPIRVRGNWRADGLHLEVRDRGTPMPDGTLPLGRLPAIDVDLMDLPEGGFGWFLIQDLAKDVVYLRQEQQNLLRFRMSVALRQYGIPDQA